MSGTIWVREQGGGSYLATVEDVPGCVARGVTREDAVENARRAFTEYTALLSKYGVSSEHWAKLDPASFTVRDFAGNEWFDEDMRPLEEHELRDFLHQMEASRAALLALVREISPDEIQRKPDTETWSVREALEHIMTTEVTFLSRMEQWPESMGALQAAHRMAFQRFSILEPKETAVIQRIFGQRWSPRRVMRRILEHEYEHLMHIKEILAELGSQRAPE